MSSNLYLGLGVVSTIISTVSWLQYYSYSGSNMLIGSEAKEMIKEGKINKIIDVRTLMEYRSGRYPGAIHIPLGDFSENNRILKSLNKNDSYVVYCNTGQRARRARELMVGYGFTNVYYLSDSYQNMF